MTFPVKKREQGRQTPPAPGAGLSRQHHFPVHSPFSSLQLDQVHSGGKPVRLAIRLKLKRHSPWPTDRPPSCHRVIDHQGDVFKALDALQLDDGRGVEGDWGISGFPDS